MKALGIDPAAIRGYEDEEFTHMAVAVNVLSGRADVGMGIYAAAKALDLDFIPVVQERYDLIISEKFWEEEKIQALLSVIRSKEFQEAVRGLGGYDLIADRGSIVLIKGLTQCSRFQKKRKRINCRACVEIVTKSEYGVNGHYGA